MDSSLIDVFLVAALGLIAISVFIFLIFFIPVLIQIAKTLEAVQTIVNTFRNYLISITSEFDKVLHSLDGAAEKFASGLGKAGVQMATTAAGMASGLKDFVEVIKEKK